MKGLDPDPFRHWQKREIAADRHVKPFQWYLSKKRGRTCSGIGASPNKIVLLVLHESSEKVKRNSKVKSVASLFGILSCSEAGFDSIRCLNLLVNHHDYFWNSSGGVSSPYMSPQNYAMPKEWILEDSADMCWPLAGIEHLCRESDRIFRLRRDSRIGRDLQSWLVVSNIFYFSIYLE